MAVNQTSTNSNVCEKIYKAICPFPLSSKVTSSAPTDQKKATDAAISTEVPVNFNTYLSPAPSKLEEVSSVGKKVEKVASRNEPVKTKVGPSNGVAPTGVTVLEKAKPLEDTAPPRKAVVGSGQDKGLQDFVKHQAVQSKGEEGNSNDKFSSYIDRSKAKLRINSNIGTGNGGGVSGEGKSLLRHDSFHDRVSDYITRAKNKIKRSTTNIGGRSVSIK